MSGVQRWVVGAIDDPRPGDRRVALHAQELSEPGCVPIDGLLDGAVVPTASRVSVTPPRWRGYSFVALLEWLVCAVLAARGAEVTWRVTRRTGASGVLRHLQRRGWDLERRGRAYVGVPPRPGPPPEPRSFEADVAGRPLRFAADWGVFSREHLDEGTFMLLEAVGNLVGIDRERSPGLVADVGTGYGPLAIGLLVSELASAAVASEVDLVALHLARMNATAAVVPVRFFAEPDPARLPPTQTTVCSIPTHVPRPVTRTLVAGLAQRAGIGTVLVAMHAALERRYLRLFEAERVRVETVVRKSHSILRLEGVSR